MASQHIRQVLFIEPQLWPQDWHFIKPVLVSSKSKWLAIGKPCHYPSGEVSTWIITLAWIITCFSLIFELPFRLGVCSSGACCLTIEASEHSEADHFYDRKVAGMLLQVCRMASGSERDNLNGEDWGIPFLGA